jgi:hypothetical protein
MKLTVGNISTSFLMFSMARLSLCLFKSFMWPRNFILCSKLFSIYTSAYIHTHLPKMLHWLCLLAAIKKGDMRHGFRLHHIWRWWPLVSSVIQLNFGRFTLTFCFIHGELNRSLSIVWMPIWATNHKTIAKRITIIGIIDLYQWDLCYEYIKI